MKKNYFIKCNKCRKFKNPKRHIFNETLLLSILCSKCGNNNDEYLSKKKVLRY